MRSGGRGPTAVRPEPGLPHRRLRGKLAPAPGPAGRRPSRFPSLGSERDLCGAQPVPGLGPTPRAPAARAQGAVAARRPQVPAAPGGAGAATLKSDSGSGAASAPRLHGLAPVRVGTSGRRPARPPERTASWAQRALEGTGRRERAWRGPRPLVPPSPRGGGWGGEAPQTLGLPPAEKGETAAPAAAGTPGRVCAPDLRGGFGANKGSSWACLLPPLPSPPRKPGASAWGAGGLGCDAWVFCLPLGSWAPSWGFPRSLGNRRPRSPRFSGPSISKFNPGAPSFPFWTRVAPIGPGCRLWDGEAVPLVALTAPGSPFRLPAGPAAAADPPHLTRSGRSAGQPWHARRVFEPASNMTALLCFPDKAVTQNQACPC